MLTKIIVLIGSLTASVVTVQGQCSGFVTIEWQNTQNAGGTCPAGFTGPGGLAYDSMVADAIAMGSRRRLSMCGGTSSSSSSSSCAPLANFPPSDRRKLNADGCSQCTGTDDDGSTVFGDDDTVGPVVDMEGSAQARRLTYGYDDGYVGALLTFTVTAEVPADEDPLEVMAAVESDIAAYFADEDASCMTWMTRARALGAEIEDGTHIVFGEPQITEDSVHISRPGDFIDHHYNSNSNVRVGVWIGVSLAGVALLLSGKYGVKAYKLKHEADVMEKEKAAAWANVEECAGDITMNPLGGTASGAGATGAAAGAGGNAEVGSVRQRTNSATGASC